MSCPRTLPPARARRWRARLAGAVAILVATAGAVATTSAPATAASLSGNPLAGAAGFTVVSYGDAELSNHEIEGSVAVGGNVSVRTGQGPYNLIHKAAGNGDYVLPTLGGTPVRLVVGGFDRASSTQPVRVASGGYTDAATQLGRMTIGSTTGVGIAGRGAGVCVQAPTTTDCSGPVIEQSAAPQTVAWTVQPTAFDTLVPTAARDTMAQWSQGIAEGRLVGAEAVTLGSTAQPMNGVDVTLVAGKVNVLRVAAADFPSTDWKLRFPTVKPSATTPLVIDVVAADGASVLLPMETIGAYDAPGGSSDNNFARYMLWNIDQAPGSTVYLSGNGIVPGSLLAPSSTVIIGLSGPSDTSADKTLIEGQIVAASLLLRNSGEVHHYGYAASLEIGGGEGGFSLRKALSGIAAGDLPDGASTQFSVDYFLDGATTKAGTLTLTADGTLVAGPQDLPVGTEVTFREATPSAPTGTVWTGATFSPSTVEIADGDDVEVTVTNSYRAAVGGFRVAKALSGLTAADLPDGDDTEFAVDYFLDGSTTKAGTLVVTADGTPVAGPTSLPLGTVVTFGEPSAVAPTGQVWTGATISPSSVTITADGQSTLVTVTNSYRDAVGGFSLSKALDGVDAVDLPDGGATEFEVDYFLNGSTTKAGTLTVTADGVVVAGPQNLPLGTVVTFAEPTAVAPSGTVWTGAAFAPSSVTVTADGQNTSVTVTNSYRDAVGGFSLAKALDGVDAVDLPDGGATEFEVDYFLNGSTTKAGTLTVTADGVVVAGPQNLPLGTVVTFAEPTAVAPSGTVWTGAAFAPSSVTVTADGQNTSVTVTNSYRDAVGGFSLAKALDGIDPVDLPDGGDTEFEVDYFLNGSTTKAGTLTVTADGAVVGGPTNLPLGTVVTFDELTPAPVAGGDWVAATFAPATVEITADGQLTRVTLTNMFDADDPTGPGTGGGPGGGDGGGGGDDGGGDDGGGDGGGDDDGGDDGTAPRGEDDGGGDSSAPGAGDGSRDEGGVLARTGADAWTTLGVALTLALTGAVLLVLRRRETATAGAAARHGLRRP